MIDTISYEFRKYEAIIQRALEEDMGAGDVTSETILPASLECEGLLIAKEEGVIAGLEIASMTFFAVDNNILFEEKVHDGDYVPADTVIARVAGNGRAILGAERVALNFLQRMSGIATMTNRYVEAIGNHKAIVLDTRKTAPGLRILDKLAVRLGGGRNHRFGLYDMVLIKENHVTAAGSITAAVSLVRQNDRKARPIEVEVTSFAELHEALTLNVHRIMLDNMSLEQMREAVKIADGRTPLEASGNVSLETIADIAATGVDFISSGSLTHSVKALDISLLLK